MTSVDLFMNTPVSLDHDGIGYRGRSLQALQAAGLPAAIVLSAAQDALKDSVDVQAEALRTKVLTPGAGQAMEYQEVRTQALAAVANPAAATPALYPMLAATIGVEIDPQSKAPAADVVGVARSVVAAYEGWLMIGAAIRQARLKGKVAITEATTIEAALDAFDAIAWPQLG